MKSLKTVCQILGFIVALISITKNIYAAEIYGKKGDIYIEGVIKRGDYEKFVDVLRYQFKYFDKNDPTSLTNNVVLDSEGGDVLEAMKIGKLTRNLHLSTKPRRLCASACLLIYASGVYRYAEGIKPCPVPRGLSKEERAKRLCHLGFHRPRFSDIEGFASLDPDVASIKYNVVLDNIKNFLNDMEVPDNFTELMFTASSEDMILIPWEQIKTAGILDNMPPSIKEWQIANCPSLQLDVIPNTDPREDLERMKEEIRLSIQCKMQLGFNAREKAISEFLGN